MKNKTRSKETRSVFSIILNKPLARVLLLAVLLAAAGFTAYSIAFSSIKSRMGLDIVCLPTTGSCSVIRTGTGIIVIDAGTENDSALLLDYLHENNIRKIDAMIITSDDPYCCSGAAEVVGNVLVEQLITPDLGEFPSIAWGRVEAAALKEGLVPTVIAEDSAFILQNTSFLLLPVNKDGLALASNDDLAERWAAAEKLTEPAADKITDTASDNSGADASHDAAASGSYSDDTADHNHDADMPTDHIHDENDTTDLIHDKNNTTDHVHNENVSTDLINNEDSAANLTQDDGDTAGINLTEDTAATIPAPPCCLFVSVMYGYGTVLFTGNAPDKAIITYLSSELGGTHDVLMLPHNGRMFDSAEALLSASAPSSVIIPCYSADAVDESVSNMISKARAKTYLTCSGEIRISSNGSKMKVIQ